MSSRDRQAEIVGGLDHDPATRRVFAEEVAGHRDCDHRQWRKRQGRVERQGGAEPLCPTSPDIAAQLHHAVQEELTVSLQDFLLRRTGIGTGRCQGGDCATAIGQRMAGLLGWSSRRLDAELEAYQAHVARSQRFRA